MTVLPLEMYRDPDFGVLIPTAAALTLLNASEHKIRRFRPLLKEDEDYLRQRGGDHVERIFYTASGLIKLCNSLATPETTALKQALELLLTQSGSNTAPESGAELATVTPTSGPLARGDSSPYAPMQRTAAGGPSLQQPVVPVAESTLTSPSRLPQEAAAITQELARHLAPPIAHQVGEQVGGHLAPNLSRVEQAIARIEQQTQQVRPLQLAQAETLFEQQRISLEQFQTLAEILLNAQNQNQQQQTQAAKSVEAILAATPQPEVNLFHSVGIQQDASPLSGKMLRAMQIQTRADLALVGVGLLGVLGSLFFLFTATHPPRPIYRQTVPQAQPQVPPQAVPQIPPQALPPVQAPQALPQSVPQTVPQPMPIQVAPGQTAPAPQYVPAPPPVQP